MANSKDDLVCICNSVSYRKIEEAVDAGARTYEDILEKTGAGSTCGGCIQRIEEILSRIVV